MEEGTSSGAKEKEWCPPVHLGRAVTGRQGCRVLVTGRRRCSCSWMGQTEPPVVPETRLLDPEDPDGDSELIVGVVALVVVGYPELS